VLITQVRKTIKDHALLKKKQTVLIGVSGGPDSLTLLFCLYALRRDYALNLHVAHLDHGLRRASRADAAFVNRVCEQLNIPIHIERLNPERLQRPGSLEDNARKARHAFFFRIARSIKASAIALGHTLDDQAETVLMRLLRGSGLSGLSAISTRRVIDGYTIIRPLLETRRREIESYLRKKKIVARRDSSNAQDIYLRNRIRNRLLPLLEKEYNRNVKEIMSHTAESAGQDYDYLLQQADALLKRMGRTIAIPVWLKMHPAMQRLVLRQAIARTQGDMRRITFKHIREIEDLIRNRPDNAIVHLPRNIYAVKAKTRLAIRRRQ